MNSTIEILIQIGNAVFQMLPAIEKYGPQIIDDLKQDWEMISLLVDNGGSPTQEQHDRVMANLERAHNEFQTNTVDVDDVPPNDLSGA